MATISPAIVVSEATITWAVEDCLEKLDTEQLQGLGVQGVEAPHQLPHRGQALQLQELLKRPAREQRGT